MVKEDFATDAIFQEDAKFLTDVKKRLGLGSRRDVTRYLFRRYVPSHMRAIQDDFKKGEPDVQLRQGEKNNDFRVEPLYAADVKMLTEVSKTFGFRSRRYAFRYLLNTYVPYDIEKIVLEYWGGVSPE